MNIRDKQRVATVIAIGFHLIGLVGIFLHQSFFVQATDFNLVLMFLLILFTQPQPGKGFFFFILSCFITGIVAELIGTQTALLFGKYSYGDVLGPQISNVPLIIGINWFIVVYCCGVTISYILRKFQQKTEVGEGTRNASLLIDSAALAVFFDWIMEPAAIKLGYWSWDGDIPLFNYISWFIISLLLMAIFRLCRFRTDNKFAVNLLLIQIMFFLLIRTFL